MLAQMKFQLPEPLGCGALLRIGMAPSPAPVTAVILPAAPLLSKSGRLGQTVVYFSAALRHPRIFTIRSRQSVRPPVCSNITRTSLWRLHDAASKDLSVKSLVGRCSASVEVCVRVNMEGSTSAMSLSIKSFSQAAFAERGVQTPHQLNERENLSQALTVCRPLPSPCCTRFVSFVQFRSPNKLQTQQK